MCGKTRNHDHSNRDITKKWSKPGCTRRTAQCIGSPDLLSHSFISLARDWHILFLSRPKPFSLVLCVDLNMRRSAAAPMPILALELVVALALVTGTRATSVSWSRMAVDGGAKPSLLRVSAAQGAVDATVALAVGDAGLIYAFSDGGIGMGSSVSASAPVARPAPPSVGAPSESWRLVRSSPWYNFTGVHTVNGTHAVVFGWSNSLAPFASLTTDWGKTWGSNVPLGGGGGGGGRKQAPGASTASTGNDADSAADLVLAQSPGNASAPLGAFLSTVGGSAAWSTPDFEAALAAMAALPASPAGATPHEASQALSAAADAAGSLWSRLTPDEHGVCVGSVAVAKAPTATRRASEAAAGARGDLVLVAGTHECSSESGPAGAGRAQGAAGTGSDNAMLFDCTPLNVSGEAMAVATGGISCAATGPMGESCVVGGATADAAGGGWLAVNRDPYNSRQWQRVHATVPWPVRGVFLDAAPLAVAVGATNGGGSGGILQSVDEMKTWAAAEAPPLSLPVARGATSAFAITPAPTPTPVSGPYRHCAARYIKEYAYVMCVGDADAGAQPVLGFVIL